MTRRLIKAILLSSVSVGLLFGQVRPAISLVGGDDVPAIKEQIKQNLEVVLLEMNRLSRDRGNLDLIRPLFAPDAFATFEQFVLRNKAYTARKEYSPQMVSRRNGEAFDIRSIGVRVKMGETAGSDLQSLVFSFSRKGMVIAVRAVIPNQDYQSMIASGRSQLDSLVRGTILDFLERFRMAYNTKDADYLEKVYSDDALIIVGSVVKEKEQKRQDDFSRLSLLSRDKVRLVQLTKREYLDNLRKYAFRSGSFLSVRFDSIVVLQHEKHDFIYGVTCRQSWRSATYSDEGYLFLMMDFRNRAEPVIHVRSWQPKAFDDGSFVGLYDFDVVVYR
jgi:hypothetical protein